MVGGRATIALGSDFAPSPVAPSNPIPLNRWTIPADSETAQIFYVGPGLTELISDSNNRLGVTTHQTEELQMYTGLSGIRFHISRLTYVS
jgi:hypothetical protein